MPVTADAPALTKVGRAWRYLVAILGGLLLWLAQFTGDDPPGVAGPLVDLLLGTGCIVALQWRRRWPFAVAALTTVAAATSAFGAVAAIIAFVSLATTRRWRPIVAVALLNVASTYAGEAVDPTGPSFPWWAAAVISVIFSLLVVTLGLYLGTRRDLARAQQERTAEAERQQVARVEQARMGERARIAREMHDVLAHRLSLVSLHAGAMAYRADLGVDELRASAGVVQENAHQALIDLREVLGVLREAEGSGDVDRSARSRPQPTLADLPELMLEARAACTPVEVRDELPQRTIPDTVARTAYRIIQESLTNARKHAPGAPVIVRLTEGEADQLSIEVSNPLPEAPLVRGTGEAAGSVPDLPGAGVGLIGLKERASLAGGTLVHGPTPQRSYRVQARLPWT